MFGHFTTLCMKGLNRVKRLSEQYHYTNHFVFNIAFFVSSKRGWLSWSCRKFSLILWIYDGWVIFVFLASFSKCYYEYICPSKKYLTLPHCNEKMSLILYRFFKNKGKVEILKRFMKLKGSNVPVDKEFSQAYID